MDDIEITPEMIEAGLEQFFRYEPCECDPEDILRDLFEAMISVRQPTRVVVGYRLNIPEQPSPVTPAESRSRRPQ